MQIWQVSHSKKMLKTCKNSSPNCVVPPYCWQLGLVTDIDHGSETQLNVNENNQNFEDLERTSIGAKKIE